MITVKATETRLHTSTKYVYNQINNLYAKDMLPRVLGMYTFSDNNEPNAIAAIRAAKIQLSRGFKFNNSSMFMHPEASEFVADQFKNCMDNHADFIKFIKDKDRIPVSLFLTQQVLEKRKSMENHGQSAKEKAMLLSMNLFEIGNKIKEVRKNVNFLNEAKDNVCLPAGTRTAFTKKKVDHRVIKCNECE